MVANLQQSIIPQLVLVSSSRQVRLSHQNLVLDNEETNNLVQILDVVLEIVHFVRWLNNQVTLLSSLLPVVLLELFFGSENVEDLTASMDRGEVDQILGGDLLVVL